jgi:tripartite-type tricarboxylate transporter receptor subunit TctC
MKKFADGFLIFLLVTALFFTAIPGHAAPYYEGKTIEIMGESRVGGGTDTMARIVAAFLPKYIPGKPNIVVVARPGAGGAIANNIFYQSGIPDGLHLMMNSSSPISLQVRSRDIVKYDLTKLVHIGNVNRGTNLLIVRKDALKRLTDPKAQPVVCGTKEGEETWMGMALWGKEFLGWNIRWIPGYSGTSDMELAFRRGEIDMFGTTNGFIIKRMLDEGLAVPISQGGIFKKGKFTRRPDFADVPTFVEVLGSKKPTGVAWQSYMAWVGAGDVDKFLVAPRNTPKQYSSILIDAFGKMVKDPQFDERVKRMVSEVYDVGVGQEVADILKESLNVPLAALDFGRNLQIKFGLVATTKK